MTQQNRIENTENFIKTVLDTFFVPSDSYQKEQKTLELTLAIITPNGY